MVNGAKLISFLLISLAFTSVSNAFETKASQAILIEMDTEEELYSKNPDQAMAPSSMSKLMTAYLVFEALKNQKITMDSEIIVSENAWRTGGSKMFIEVDNSVKVKDLLLGMLVQSGNDATIALAEGIAGSEASFVALMNQKSQDMGLLNSSFSNVTGLPDPHHYMSARDLAILAKKLIKDFPEYYALFSEKEFTYNNITQPNRNSLIGDEGVDGLKTGHTDAGGYGLVISAQKDGNRLIAVVNGLSSDKERVESSKNLIAYGFSDFSFTQVDTSNISSLKTNIWHGDKSKVKIAFNDSIKLILPKSIPLDQIKIKAMLHDKVQAPIKLGESIGELDVEIPDYKTIKIALKAANSVEEGSFIRKMAQNAWERLSCLVDEHILNSHTKDFSK